MIPKHKVMIPKQQVMKTLFNHQVWWKIHAGGVFNTPGASKQQNWVVFHEIHKSKCQTNKTCQKSQKYQQSFKHIYKHIKTQRTAKQRLRHYVSRTKNINYTFLFMLYIFLMNCWFPFIFHLIKINYYSCLGSVAGFILFSCVALRCVACCSFLGRVISGT